MTKKAQPQKFQVGEKVFVCDGSEHHGKIATIAKFRDEYGDRYEALLPGENKIYWNSPYGFAKESVFCHIEKAPCELCGSPEGIVKPSYPECKFGDVWDLARKKFPYAISCICPECQRLFDLRDKKLKERNEARTKFRDAEEARRKKEGLCRKCGGKLHHSGPCLVYEGTYETTIRCTQCGKEDCYT